MKKFLLGALIMGVFFTVSACATGPVADKRAPGSPGHKQFEIQIQPDAVVGPSEVWVKVSEHVWDRCSMGESYPKCAG